MAISIFAISIFALLAALLISYLVTPIIRNSARAIGFVDRPDGHRKVQAQAVALGGGLACLIAVTATVLFFVCIEPDFFLSAGGFHLVVGLPVAILIVVTIGVIDDYSGLRGSYKLFWQVVAAGALISAGLVENELFDIPIPAFGVLFTLLWLVGTTNSFNLLDGVDGLAGCVGVVFSVTFGLIALFSERPADAMMAFALAGALLGFLRYNMSRPSTIYLGDTGSMLIGLLLGVIAIRCSLKRSAILAFAVPLTVWAIPIFDSAAAVLRRKLTGRSIYTTDRGHIHHVLLTRGMSSRQAVFVIVGLCTLTSSVAFVGWYFAAQLHYEGAEWVSIAVVMIVIGGLVLSRVFGHVELFLLNRELLGIGQFLTPFARKSTASHKATYQQNDEWELLWNALVEATDRFDLVKMRLNLCIPQLHENFFASWRRGERVPGEQKWQVEIPFIVDGKPVGSLHVIGQQQDEFASLQIGDFLDFIEPIESQLQSIISAQPTGLPDMPRETPVPDSVGVTSG